MKISIDRNTEAYLSDEDILEVVLDANQQLEEALEDCISGLINPLIVRGPPGVGKTEAVKIATRQSGIKSTDLLSTDFQPPSKEDIKDGCPPYPWNPVGPLATVDGALIRGADYSRWAFAADLYANKDNGILCMDDNDDMLKDKIAIAMLMGATEQSDERVVSYVKANSTNELKIYGVESRFQVSTPVIILTNIDMKLLVAYAQQKEKDGKRVKDAYISRWEALMSRGTYVDLQMNTPRSVRVWCEEAVRGKKELITNSKFLEEKYGRSLTTSEAEEVMKWIRENQGKLADRLDFRTYLKVAGIHLDKKKKDWKKSAQVRYLHAVS